MLADVLATPYDDQPELAHLAEPPGPEQRVHQHVLRNLSELCSTCQHGASAAGQRVYEALGVGKNIEYHPGNLMDPHGHCSVQASQAEPLRRAIRTHLKRTAPADGRITPASYATADLAKFVPWTAPTLAE